MYLQKAFGIILIWGMNSFVFAQEINYETVNTGGQSASAGNLLLESSVGGVISSSLQSAQLLLTQGFLQPLAGTGTVPVGEDPAVNSPGITSGGTTFVNGTTLLEFTVGEAFSTTLIKPAGVLTQGLLQPYTDDAPMPVTLVSFEARRAEAQLVQLDWVTSEEINNRGFGIERKNNEHDFQQIGFVTSSASGSNSHQRLSYTYQDPNTYTGISYYRLKQYDTDGTFTYSTIKAVPGAVGEEKVLLTVSPVPTDGPLKVEMAGAGRDILAVFQNDGKMVSQFEIREKTPLQIYLSTPGIYFLRLAEYPSLVRRVVVR